MSYKIINANCVLNKTTGESFPLVDGCAEYEEFKRWKDANVANIPEAADPPPPPSQDELDTAAAKAYAKLNALRTMTPAQVQAWVAANVTNLAQAQDAIATLAIAVSILARRL